MTSLLVLLSLAVTPLERDAGAEAMVARNQLDARIAASVTNTALRASIEEDLIGVLRNSLNGQARLFAAQRLSVVGTEASLDIWTNITASAEEAHLACVALADHPSPRAGEILRQALPSAKGLARLQILDALAHRAEAASTALFADLLKDSDPAVVEQARAALTKIPGPDAAAALGTAPGAQSAALIRAEREKDIATLQKLMQDNEPPTVRRGAWNALETVDSAGLVGRIRETLKAGDPVLSPLAALATSRLKKDSDVLAISALLPELTQPARGWLSAALGDLGGTIAREALQTELATGNSSDKLAVVAALRSMGDSQSATALAEALREANPELTAAIEAALIDLLPGPSTDQLLQKVLPSLPAPQRAKLIGILSARNAVGALPDIWNATSSEDKALVTAAWRAIGQLAPATELPRLLERMDDGNAVESAAARLIGRIADPEARTTGVRVALDKAQTTNSKMALIRLLGLCETDEALNAIVEKLKDSDPRVHDIAARTLSSSTRPAAVDPMLALLQTTQTPAVRAAALRGLLKIAGEHPARGGEKIRAQYRPMVDQAQTVEEKKIVLGAMAASRQFEIISLLKKFLSDDSVRSEAESAFATLCAPYSKMKPIFDGKSFEGWTGDTQKTWRVEDGMLVAGSLDKTQPNNEYLSTTREYGNFDLILQYRLEGTEGFVNGGVQFRSTLTGDARGVVGYQADLGKGHDGAMYDEHRRNKFLARPSEATRDEALIPGGWNVYRIRAEGPRVRIWLNGILTVDYTELDQNIPQRGVISVQIHGNGKSKVAYRGLYIEELP